MIRPYLRGFIQALIFYPGRVASQHESIALATALPWRGTNEDSPDYDQFISGYAEGMKMIEQQIEGAYVVAPYEQRLESMLIDANQRRYEAETKLAAYKEAYESLARLSDIMVDEQPDRSRRDAYRNGYRQIRQLLYVSTTIVTTPARITTND